ncbi:MAG: hypothetical protein ACRDPR_02225 [Nocardioidaceae bacterium]
MARSRSPVGSVRSGWASSPRRSPHAPENVLGDRLAVVAELADDDLSVLRSVIDGLVAKTRLRTLAGGIS